MVEPIRPDQVDEAKSKIIPDKVIQVFNDLIAKNWNGYSSTIVLSDAVAWVASRMDIESNDVYKSGWMEIEDTFRRVGWEVEFDKQSIGDTGPSKFIFRKPKR